MFPGYRYRPGPDICISLNFEIAYLWLFLTVSVLITTETEWFITLPARQVVSIQCYYTLSTIKEWNIVAFSFSL